MNKSEVPAKPEKKVEIVWLLNMVLLYAKLQISKLFP